MEEKSLNMLKVFDKMVDFIKGLSDEEITNIANEKYKLVIEANRKKENKELKKYKDIIDKTLEDASVITIKEGNWERKIYCDKSGEELNEFDLYISELTRFTDKKEAMNYLIIEQKLTVTKLKILAKKLSIYVKSKSKRVDIASVIVESIVGSRIKLDQLRIYK